MSEESIMGKRFRISDMLLKIAIYMSAFFAVLILIGIIGYVFWRGLGGISWQFLSTVQSRLNETYGIIGNIVNTLYIIVITLLIAVPVGVGSAVYLNEYAKRGHLVRFIEFTTETLSGIPSIIFGMFGMVFFGEVLGLGFSILCGALTLSIMVLPIITRTTQETLKTVPESYRSGALGLGATKWYMIRTIILPDALGGIITSVILSIGRIVGESAALLFTAGSAYLLPKGLFSHLMTSGGTLTIEMYLRMSNADYENAFAVASVILVVVFLINICTKLVHKNRRRV